MRNIFSRFASLIFILITIAGAVFAFSLVALNSQSVSIELPVHGVLELTLGLALMLSFVAGVLLTLVCMTLANFITNYKLKRAQRKLRGLAEQ